MTLPELRKTPTEGQTYRLFYDQLNRKNRTFTIIKCLPDGKHFVVSTDNSTHPYRIESIEFFQVSRNHLSLISDPADSPEAFDEYNSRKIHEASSILHEIEDTRKRLASRQLPNHLNAS